MKSFDFYDTKNGMIEPTCKRFEKWKNGHLVKLVRFDNASENTKLENTGNIKAWKVNLEL